MLPDATAQSIAEIRCKLNQATQELRRVQSESVDLRYQFYEDLLAKYLNDNDPITRPTSITRAKIVQNTIKAEQSRQMFRNIRNATTATITGSGLQQVNVPRPRQQTDIPEDAYITLQTHAGSGDIEWETILNPADIETHLLRYNRHSFRAASVSPCGHGLIHDTLTFTSLSDGGAQLLKGQLPDALTQQPTLLKTFLLSFAMPPAVPQIQSTMTEDQVQNGFKTWRETTSTSPSGRHLGHYRALVTDDTLRYCLTTFLNIAITNGISITRWQHAANVMIEKDKGRPNINRLRIIHLFEADLNLS